MHASFLPSYAACLLLASTLPVLVTASGYSQPVVVNAYEMLTRTVQERAAVWAALGFDLNAAMNSIPTIVVGPPNNPPSTPQVAAAKSQVAEVKTEAAPTQQVQQFSSSSNSSSTSSSQASNSGINPGVGGGAGGGGSSTSTNATGSGSSSSNNNNAGGIGNTGINGNGNGNPGSSGINGNNNNANNSNGNNDTSIGNNVQIDDAVANQIAVNAPRGPPKEDKVGGIGGDGTGETAPDNVVSAFYDAQSGNDLFKLIKDMHAKPDKNSDPASVRPIYVSHETAAEAYKKWTGKDEADPCKGDVVKEAVFAFPFTCMSKISAGNMPTYVGYPALRRRACIFTNVRCIDKKALILTVDALNKTIVAQTGDRKGDYWYAGRVFARPDIVNQLYRLLYPNSINDPKKNVCDNKGPDEFGSEYSLGAVLAIFAESEKCLTAAANAAGKACRRVAVDCIGKWNPA